MPNVGKPSRGCQSCRQRKVKCDTKRPSCSQCLRIGKACYGYRDALTMMFQDQNEVVVKKAKSRYEALAAKRENEKRKGATQSQTSLSQIKFPSPEVQSVASLLRLESSQTLHYGLLPCIEEQALGFFFSNYVVQPAHVPRGSFEWLPDLLKQPNNGILIQKSALAVSFAGLAISRKNQSIMNRAREEYVSALDLTNKALKHNHTAKQDNTLICVMLLGLFENHVNQRKGAIEAWAKHVRGACTLLELRSEGNYNNELAKSLLQQFYGTLLLVSLETGMQIPSRAAELWEELEKFSDYSVQGKEWTKRMVRFMYDAINLASDERDDPAALVTTALQLDAELQSIKSLMPSVWKYKTVYVKDPGKHVYGNWVHVYVDPWITQMWNNLRSCRIALHKVIIRQLNKGNSQSPPLFSLYAVRGQIHASEEAMRATAAAICASTPQITGQIPATNQPLIWQNLSKLDDPLSSNAQDGGFKLKPQGTFLDSSRANGLHHVIWPVYTVGSLDICPDDLRQWAIDQLSFLALKVGTQQALVFAEELRQRSKADENTQSSREADSWGELAVRQKCVDFV